MPLCVCVCVLVHLCGWVCGLAPGLIADSRVSSFAFSRVLLAARQIPRRQPLESHERLS